jgi:metal transporter CNNM
MPTRRVIDVDNGEPAFVLDSHYFLRDALFDQLESNPGAYWHRPVIVRDMQTKLGDVIGKLKVSPERPDDDVVDNDLILVWGAQKRIITGADMWGALRPDRKKFGRSRAWQFQPNRRLNCPRRHSLR